MRVAIALATYRPDLGYFRLQVDSLRRQTFQNWVCFISDESPDAVSRAGIAAQIEADPRLILIEKMGPGTGVIYNFEAALKAIPPGFDYICFCDQDDIWREDKLTKMVRYLEDRPGIQMVHSDLRLIDSNGEVLDTSCWQNEGRRVEGLTLSKLVLRNVVTGCSLMFRSSLLSRILPFPGDLKGEYLHDHWVALNAIQMGPLGAIYEPLVDYRQHSNNVIGAQKVDQRSLSGKVMNLLTLKSRGVRGVLARQKIAIDLLRRLKDNEIQDAQKELLPIVKIKPIFYLTYFLRSIGKKFEFRWSLQLLVGSFFIGVRNRL